MTQAASLDALEKAEQMFATRSAPQVVNTSERVDVPAYLDRYGVEHTIKHKGSETIYGLKYCVFDPSHTNGDAAIIQGTDGALGFKCFHNSCMGKGWKDARQTISGDDPLSAFINGTNQNQQAASMLNGYKRGLDACVVTFAELLNMDIPERSKIFVWLPEGGITMVYGGRGIGKTFFTLSLAASIASGAPFLKWGEPLKTMGVLIVDGEMALSDLRSRLTALLVKQPVEPLQIISGEVAFAKTDTDINLVDGTQRDDILGILEANKDIRLVIIDNISCLFSGIRESSKDDWEQITPWLLAMRRRGVAVVLVHHAGKGGDQRGTSGREDLLDTVIRLEPVHGALSEGARFVVRFTKSRGAFGDEVEPFEALLDLDSDGLWTWRKLEESNYERMLSLARQGVSTVTEMAEELGVTKGTVSKMKRKGIEQGDLTRSSSILLIDEEV